MDDKSAQEDEILALKSIYEENEIFQFDETNRNGIFYIRYEAPDSKTFNLNFVKEKKLVKVKYLTPIKLEFVFPTDYPSVSQPDFTLSCRWISLNMIKEVCSKLDEIWQQNFNQCVLFTWISFLTYDLFDYLNIDIDDIKINDEQTVNDKDEKRAIKEPFSISLIENYDNDQNEMKFQSTYFSCQVCFMEKLGKECFKFNKCEHVFCNECMRTYFETQITDGNVKSLTCPQDKCESQALPNQVLHLVDIKVFNRYDNLLLKDSLNSMMDIVYCPRAECQCAVIPEETLARCPDCKYVFCALCRQGYHGVEPCKITNKQLKEICDKYTNGTEDEKKDLIKRFGESRIKRAIEEVSSMELITSTSKQCPKCKSWMQKLDGCNKMTCTKCHCYFCWLCFKILSKQDPYSHFNSQNSECFEKLFEGVDGGDNDDNDDDFQEFFEDSDDDESDEE